jgi:glycosyltransferase involved in cell wall biosynthesis
VRVLYVSQYFPPEMGAPSARVSELAARWVRGGHEVCVLTGFPHHPTGIVPPEYRRRVYAHETWQGADVVRCYVYATPNRGVLKRSLSYLSFAVSSVTLGAVARPARGADLVVATSPQFFCAVAGWMISRLKGVPLVLEIRDLWPESIVELGVIGRNSLAHRILAGIERFLYRSAALLVGVTDSYRETWIGQGIPAKKIRVAKNGVDLERFAPQPRENAARRELGLEGKFVVSYIGTHGMSQGLATLVEAADALRDEPRLHFLFVGEGAEKADVMALARQRGLRNVTFLGQQSRDRIPQLIAAADLEAVLLRKRDLFTGVIPSKIFEIMGCARPILLGVEGEAARIVAESGAGYLARPEDPLSLVEQIRLALADPAEAERRGRAGREYVARNFDRDVLARRYAADLQDVARADSRAARDGAG